MPSIPPNLDQGGAELFGTLLMTTRLTRVPGTAAATASAIAPDPGIAWCTLPKETMRAITSISFWLMCLPSKAVYDVGAAIRAKVGRWSQGD